MTYQKAIILVFTTFIVSTLSEDDEWKWKDNKNGRSARYEIEENQDEFFNRPGGGFGSTGSGTLGYRPGFSSRPDFGRPDILDRPGRPQMLDRPGRPQILDRPGRPDFFDRPGVRPDIFDRPGYLDGGNYGQGGDLGYPGVLPGGRPPLRNFDTCTCKVKFNCKSPGISYGTCDVGKSYCCFNKNGELELSPAPSRPVHRPENGILVGPSYGKPTHGRPGYGQGGYEGIRDNGIGGYGGNRGENGILVGPGGPTGIIGRPGGSRPHYSADNGVLVGPGGPRDVPYGRPYHRRSN